MRSASATTPVTADRQFSIRLPDGTTCEGPVVDLRGVDTDARLSPAVLDTAIAAGCPTPADVPRVHAPVPGPVHTHVSPLTPEVSLDRRAALAAVAVARGIETEYDGEIRATCRALRESPPEVGAAELREARRRAAEAGAETERLRERVATIRGRVEALRDASDGPALGAAEQSLSEATRELSEAATERVAADQRLSLLEARARDARDERDARFELEDRLGNLERAAREVRVETVEPEFRDARRQFASQISAVSAANPAADSDLPDALAVAHIAPVAAPVVVTAGAAEVLGGPEPAFDRLEIPVIVR